MGGSGDNAPMGPMGDIGGKGDRGEDGVQGNKGTTGEKGVTGPDGVEGPQGDEASLSNHFGYCYIYTPHNLTALFYFGNYILECVIFFSILILFHLPYIGFISLLSFTPLQGFKGDQVSHYMYIIYVSKLLRALINVKI